MRIRFQGILFGLDTMTDYLNDIGTTPLWRPEVLWDEIPSWDFDMERQILEFEGTSHDLTAISQYRPHKFSFVARNFGKVEEKAVLDFYTARQGALEKFWFPLPAKLFDLDRVDGEFILDFWDFQGHERIYIEDTDGNFITNWVEYNAVEEYWFVTWGVDARRVGLLLLCRFENDSLEMNHLSCDITETKIALVELVREYADIEVDV